MTPAEMNQAFDTAFRQVQELVPDSARHRDSDMCRKYAMYIGVMESLIKTYVPTNKRAQVIRDLQNTIAKL